MFQWKERRGAKRRNFSGCEKSVWAPEEVEVSTDREGGGAQTFVSASARPCRGGQGLVSGLTEEEKMRPESEFLIFSLFLCIHLLFWVGKNM